MCKSTLITIKINKGPSKYYTYVKIKHLGVTQENQRRFKERVDRCFLRILFNVRGSGEDRLSGLSLVVMA